MGRNKKPSEIFSGVRRAVKKQDIKKEMNTYGINNC